MGVNTDILPIILKKDERQDSILPLIFIHSYIYKNPIDNRRLQIKPNIRTEVFFVELKCFGSSE